MANENKNQQSRQDQKPAGKKDDQSKQNPDRAREVSRKGDEKPGSANR